MKAIPLETVSDRALGTWVPPSRRYLRGLFAMLMSATIFEGYDITIFHLCTPDIARTFHMGDPAVGAWRRSCASAACSRSSS